jgi:hypothetical protein
VKRPKEAQDKDSQIDHVLYVERSEMLTCQSSVGLREAEAGLID